MENQPEQTNDFTFPWLDDEHWAKAYGQTQMKINGLLGIFDKYGMGIYITPVLEQIMAVVVDFSIRVRGDLDKNIGEYIEPIPKDGDWD